MVIIDTIHTAVGAAAISAERDSNLLRVDLSRGLSLPKEYAGSHERVAALEKVGAACRYRGELIARMNPRASEQERKGLKEKIDRVDEQLQRLTASNAELLGQDPAFREVYRSHAQRSENVGRFMALAAEQYRQGINAGESFGRTVHEERLRKAEDHAIRLSVAVQRFHGQSPVGDRERGPATPVDPSAPPLEGGRPDIHQVLSAASELGKRDGVMNRIHAEMLASRIYRAIGGWRSVVPLSIVKDAHAVDETLSGLSKADAGLVQQAYLELTGSELKSSLLEAFGTNRCAGFLLQLHAEDAGAAAVALKRELEGTIRPQIFRQESIRSIYARLSRSEIKEVEELISLGTSGEHSSPSQWVASRVSESVSREIDAYRKGDSVTADAIRIERALSSWFGKGMVRTVLSDASPERVESVARAYKEITGRELSDDITDKLKRSPDRDLSLALLDGDEKRIRAAQVACALAYRKDFIAKPFLSVDADGRQQLIHDYEAIYRLPRNASPGHQVTGDFWRDLKACVWRDDYLFLSAFPRLCERLDRAWWPTTGSYPFIESAVRNGRLSSAELVRYFMVGLGTDIEGIYAVLSNRSVSSIASIEKEYASRYPPGWFCRSLGRIPFVKHFVILGDLRHDLNVELSGDTEFDVQQMLTGFRDNATLKQLCTHIYATLVARKRHETSGLLSRWSRMAHLRGDAVIKKRYDEDYEAAVDYFKKHIAASRAPSVNTVVRFLTLARLADIHANSFRETKTMLGDVFLNSGAFVGVILGTTAVLALAAFSYPIVATASFIGSLTWRLTVGRVVLGRGFGRGEIMFQSARAFIDGVSIFTVQVGAATLGRFIGGQLSSSAAKGGFKTSFNKMIKSMENRVRRQDKARHILERESTIKSNEDIRATIQDFVTMLGDNPWPIGEKGYDAIPSLHHALQVPPEDMDSVVN